MSCKIEVCLNDSRNTFCVEHEEAKTNLKIAFDKWKIAFGSKLTVKQYLKHLTENPSLSAGKWVKEIAQYLLDEKLFNKGNL